MQRLQFVSRLRTTSTIPKMATWTAGNGDRILNGLSHSRHFSHGIVVRVIAAHEDIILHTGADYFPSLARK